MRTLTESEAALWRRVTKTVTPLGQPSASSNGDIVGYGPSPHHSVEFNPVLDLHGSTVHAAFTQATSHVERACMDPRFRYVIIITGRSGQIHDEFPRWFADHKAVKKIKPLRGGGSWEIWLKNTSTPKN